METLVQFPLNRSVSIKINFDEYDDAHKTCAFLLQRTVINKNGYNKLSVKVPKEFLKRLADKEHRKKIFKLMRDKTYFKFFDKYKTRISVMDTGMLKFKGPVRTYKNELYIDEDTFSTILTFADKDFHRNDEKAYEDTSERIDEKTDEGNLENIDANSDMDDEDDK